jgi:AraC-like DNA-binding protein
MTAMVRASGLRGYSALMRQLGADPDRLLRRYRIDPELLLDDDALLPLRATAQLFEDSAAITACADFGLRLADQQDISVLGPLAIAMQHAPTVAEALDIISRYLFVHSRGMVLSVHAGSALVPGAVEVRFELQVPGQTVSRQTLDVCLGDVHHFIELLAGPYALKAVSLPHTPIAPLSVYTRFFGAPVYPAQRHGGLHIARETFELRLQTVNPSLQRIAVDYLAQHFGNPAQTLTTRVRHLLHRTLGTAQSDKRAIAAMLNLHPRTLQRYLDAEHTSFDALRDGVQRELAQRYLCETHIPMTQLAGMLGYAEQSVLTRACRRWFGKTPSQLRRATASAPLRRRPAPAGAPRAGRENGRTRSR